MNWSEGISLLMGRLSVADIAAESGLSVSGIYDLKNGYTKEPRGMAAVKLHALIEAEKLGAGGAAPSSDPAHMAGAA